MTDQVITIGMNHPVPHGFKLIDVTHKGRERWRLLSPSIHSGVWCYANLSAYCMQNAWVFSQVYADQDDGGVPKPEWYDLRDRGFRRKAAVFNLKIAGGKEPLYTYWNNVRYKKLEARKYVYIPLYLRSIRGSQEMKQLRKMYADGVKLAVRDFGLSHETPPKTFEEALYDINSPFSHAYIIVHELTKHNEE